jgi:hypothetical protein
LVLFKIIFAVGSFINPISSENVDSDGWYTVPRPKKENVEAACDERDMSAWVVFSKQIGQEKFLISMPNEPVYRYNDPTGTNMDVFSSNESSEFRLHISPSVGLTPDQLIDQRKLSCPGAIIVDEVRTGGATTYSEITYWYDGHWYCERFISTSQTTYLLQTKSQEYSKSVCNQFSNSFSSETR